MKNHRHNTIKSIGNNDMLLCVWFLLTLLIILYQFLQIFQQQAAFR